MALSVWSAVAAVVGLAVTSTVLRRVPASDGEMEPEFHWALGLGAITPAWVVAFLSLLGSEGELVGRLKVFFVVAIGVGLVGVFTTDAVVRRLLAAGARPSSFILWLLGVAALVPAWMLTLLGWPWIRP